MSASSSPHIVGGGAEELSYTASPVDKVDSPFEGVAMAAMMTETYDLAKEDSSSEDDISVLEAREEKIRSEAEVKLQEQRLMLEQKMAVDRLKAMAVKKAKALKRLERSSNGSVNSSRRSDRKSHKVAKSIPDSVAEDVPLSVIQDHPIIHHPPADKAQDHDHLIMTVNGSFAKDNDNDDVAEAETASLHKSETTDATYETKTRSEGTIHQKLTRELVEKPPVAIKTQKFIKRVSRSLSEPRKPRTASPKPPMAPSVPTSFGQNTSPPESVEFQAAKRPAYRACKDAEPETADKEITPRKKRNVNDSENGEENSMHKLNIAARLIDEQAEIARSEMAQVDEEQARVDAQKAALAERIAMVQTLENKLMMSKKSPVTNARKREQEPDPDTSDKPKKRAASQEREIGETPEENMAIFEAEALKVAREVVDSETRLQTQEDKAYQAFRLKAKLLDEREAELHRTEKDELRKVEVARNDAHQLHMYNEERMRTLHLSEEQLYHSEEMDRRRKVLLQEFADRQLHATYQVEKQAAASNRQSAELAERLHAEVEQSRENLVKLENRTQLEFSEALQRATSREKFHYRDEIARHENEIGERYRQELAKIAREREAERLENRAQQAKAQEDFSIMVNRSNLLFEKFETLQAQLTQSKANESLANERLMIVTQQADERLQQFSRQAEAKLQAMQNQFSVPHPVIAPSPPIQQFTLGSQTQTTTSTTEQEYEMVGGSQGNQGGAPGGSGDNWGPGRGLGSGSGGGQPPGGPPGGDDGNGGDKPPSDEKKKIDKKKKKKKTDPPDDDDDDEDGNDDDEQQRDKNR